MLTNRIAETKLTIKEPSFGEQVKDWLGGMLGKIVDKRPAK